MGQVGDAFQLVGQTIEGKFRLDRVVAEGGFGVVYAGHHMGLDVPVAVKVLKNPSSLSETLRVEFAQKFVLEAKTIARLKHPAILQVLDIGVAPTALGPSAFMVLEWLDGETLAAALAARRNQGGQAAIAVLNVLRPVFDALAHAHDRGIAHRDIKPANIILVPGRRGPMAKVLDFGIAKLMSEGEEAGTGQTRTTGTLSAYSPKYAAPEQIGNTRSGPWTDVHALGLIMTEMLIDRSPYRGSTTTDIFQEVMQPQRSTPARHSVNVGPLEPVLQKALAFRPEDRYENAGDMLTAVEAAVAAMGTGATYPALDPSFIASTTLSATIADQVPPTTLHPAVRAEPAQAPPTPTSRKGVAIGAVVLVLVLAAGGAAIGLSYRSKGATSATAHAGVPLAATSVMAAPAVLAVAPAIPQPAPAPAPIPVAAAPPAAAPAPAMAAPVPAPAAAVAAPAPAANSSHPATRENRHGTHAHQQHQSGDEYQLN